MVFHPLTRSDMEAIIDIVVDEMLEKVSDRQIEITLTKGAKEIIAEKGFDENYGARPLKRVIQKYIEDPIAEEILKGKFGDGSVIQVKRKGEELDFVEVERKKIEPKKRKGENSNPEAEKTEEIER
ncbi:MAG: hypothetical protein D6814_03245 [Calditrichaeota bacterium]|nr:MAG: hypothetical protein D6814_03245 [Calditrichota bacterium]